MLKKILNGHNAYFTTYALYDEDAGKYVGLLEVHNRQVIQPYLVAWRFRNGEYFWHKFQTGQTKTFDADDEENAIRYVLSGREWKE